MIRIILYLIIIFLLNYSTVYCQWYEQVSGTGAHLYDVEFINQNTGWASGDGGDILKTTNGGINWFTQQTGVTVTILTGIHPVNGNIIYAVGYWRTLLKSTNGGTNWQIISNMPMGQGISFKEVYFINENTGWWVSQFSEYVFKTTDGMNTIDSFNVGICGSNDIYFKDELNGITVSVPPVCVLKTTNGGINWKQVLVPSIGCFAPFNQMTFIDNFTGWLIPRGECVSGRGIAVYKTTNFGDSWDTISRIQALPMTDIYGVYFSSLNTGWAGGSSTRLYKTTNGGFNWYQQVIPAVTLIQKISFVSDSIGWVVGNNGKILYTNTSGQFVGLNNLSKNYPGDFILYQNYPNPFNPSTEIKFDIPQNAFVTLRVFNAIGEEVAAIINNEYKSAGMYNVAFDGSYLASGIYFYSLEAGTFKDVKKMVLLK